MSSSKNLIRLGLSTLSIAGLSLGLSACADSADYGTGALLSVDYFGDTDVVGFHYELSNVACSPGQPIVPTTLEFNIDLADTIFPGMVQHVEAAVDPASRHLGADLFVSLEPGCWLVTAIPAQEVDGDAWLPSADCGQASLDSPIQVLDGSTAEAPVLVSQCQGDPMGAADSTVLLNHPPTLRVQIEEKINYECETIEVCAQASDVDDDPLVMLFEAVGPAAWDLQQGTPEVIGFEDGHRVWEQCALITTRLTRSYEFKVTVKDLDADGQPIEDKVEGDSRDEQTFPVLTNWIEEPLCWNSADELVFADGVDIQRAPNCSYTDAEEFYCGGAHLNAIPDGVVDIICDGTDLLEELLYPQCD